MIFSPKIYLPKDVVEMILRGEKTMTRRLVKEGEELFDRGVYSVRKNPLIDEFIDGKAVVNLDSKKKTKWRVGRDYSVQLGRGKAGVWYCPECKNIPKQYECFADGKYAYANGWKCDCQKVKITDTMTLALGECAMQQILHTEWTKRWKLLRIKIIGLRKEKLCDISAEEAKREGFKDVCEFFKAFTTLNRSIIPKKAIVCEDTGFGITWDSTYWNPDVWVIEFEVKK